MGNHRLTRCVLRRNPTGPTPRQNDLSRNFATTRITTIADASASLGTARICDVGPGAYGRYAKRLTETGMRLGDIKPASLGALSH